MKKHILQIMSIILLMVSFAVAWYSDHLFNQFFVFVIPLYVLLFVCFIVLLVLSTRRIVKQKEYTNLITFAVLAMIVVLVVFSVALIPLCNNNSPASISFFISSK